MNSLFKFFQIISLIFLSIYSYAQDSTNVTLQNLTFEDALRISLENNHGIKQAEYVVKIKESEQKAARALYLPELSLSASYITMSEDIHLDLTPVKDAITPLYSALGNYGVFSGVPNPDPNTNEMFPTLPDNLSTQGVREELLHGLEEIESAEWNKIIQEQNFGFVSAGFTYPLYAGGKIRLANKAANIRTEESINDLSLEEQELVVELVERYYGLVLANEALDVRKEVFETMNLHQRDAQKLMDEGVLSYAEFLHAKVYASEADRELKKAERQIEIAQQALKNSLSVNEYSRIIPISNLFYTKIIPSLEYFTSKMPAESDLLKKVEYKKQLVDTKYKAQRGDFMPTIAAMGTYDLVNHDLSPYMPEYLLGIGMKWNLFEGNARSRKVQAVKMQQKQVDHVFEKTQSDLLVAVKKFYQEMQMYREQLAELETATTFAEEYYRVRKKAFSEGMATAAELSDANLALAKVRIERLQAMYQFDVALSKTLFYSGLTDELSSYQNN